MESSKGSGSGVNLLWRSETLREYQERQQREMQQNKERAEKQTQLQLQQQKERLRAMVRQRIAMFANMRTVHEEASTIWLNSVVLTQSEVKRYAWTEIPSSRALALFYLSISLEKLMDIYAPSSSSSSSSQKQKTPMHTILQCVLQLLEEWDWHFLGSAMKSMRLALVLSKAGPRVHPSSQESNRLMEAVALQAQLQRHASSSDSGSRSSISISSSGGGEVSPGASANPTATSLPYGDVATTSGSSKGETIPSSGPIIKTSLFKFNGNVVYEHLLTPHVPFALCYSEVLIDLSTTVESMYRLFDAEECWVQESLYENIQKIDRRIKDCFVSPCLKEVAAIASKKSTDICESIRNGVP